ncbi:acylphosphatase [Arsenicicoccus sp. oral taxon 190]|uniref:acylphosphatase n=1 Tax=Arsenicicoccus sp. oral taxon 190 TaxID=1658671 RepID=UPI000679F4B1|nr:acylphosphatase [Arsenicicoccus sp. oral taxon 190]AKT52259.1 hypothetical protein ADJ73_15035 [Arsenicicoccus sp. oral taxon 190]
MSQDTVRTTFFVRGTVQGVGFRWWTKAQALELGLVGHARNMDDGRVEVVAQGPADAVAELGRRLDPGAGEPQRDEGLLDRMTGGVRRRPGHVESCQAQSGTPREGVSGFVEK